MNDIKKEINSIETCINQVREVVKKNIAAPAAFIATFGCQMNSRDSEKLRGMLAAMGYTMADEEKYADLVILNTCCVRENAENKVFGRIGQLKKLKEQKPEFKIVVCGCMMQQDVVIEKLRNSYRYVDVIFGTYNLHRLPQLLLAHFESGTTIIDIWDEHEDILEDLPSIREYAHRAGVNIMYGCDNLCTYCIVPYVRGRERSRTSANIIAEIEELVADGVVEVMLLGQNVNSYGKGLEEDINFAQLLHKIGEIKGLERIRFMTSHPKDLSDELIAAMRDLPKVCKHLHLPFQAGSTRVLNLMNRQYTKEQYLELINKLRREVPRISITSDVMVGFPQETEEDFWDTLDVIKKARFTSLFTFYYSKRHGTVAAGMDGQVDELTAKNRFDRLLKVVNEISTEIAKEKLGQILQIIPDRTHTTDDGFLDGRADDNTLVHIRGGEELIGRLIDVKIIEAKPFYLMGEML